MAKRKMTHRVFCLVGNDPVYAAWTGSVYQTSQGQYASAIKALASEVELCLAASGEHPTPEECEAIASHWEYEETEDE